MKYVILIYINPESREVWSRLSEEQRAEGLQAYAAFNADVAASGELVESESLADLSQAKRVSVRDGQAMTTDGPFAEVKEFLAGFYVLECESMERALELAARIPEAAVGEVEVRPVLDWGMDSGF